MDESKKGEMMQEIERLRGEIDRMREETERIREEFREPSVALHGRRESQGRRSVASSPIFRAPLVLKRAWR